MKFIPRPWRLISSRVDASRRAERNQHDAAERVFWRDQIRAAWYLNWITLVAAVIALVTVIILICTLNDARKATIEANRAWVAPHAAYLRRVFALNDHPATITSAKNRRSTPR
jgi:hypothetical protein